MPRGKSYQKEASQKICKEVLKGKSKYHVTEEMGFEHYIIENHTKDLPSRQRSNPGIQGKSFYLFKHLLSPGVVPSNADTHTVMRSLRRHLSIICYTRLNGTVVFYLDEKNMKARQSFLETDSSKIISYQQLGVIAPNL